MPETLGPRNGAATHELEGTRQCKTQVRPIIKAREKSRGCRENSTSFQLSG
jgi:hypothetical protein